VSKAKRETIQITKFKDEISIMFFDDACEKRLETPRFDRLEKLIGAEGVLICKDVIRSMLGDNWDGRWESLEDGTSFAFNPQSPLSGRIQVHMLHKLGLHESVRPALRNQRKLFDFPRLWALFGFCLRKKTRERIFEPALQDLLTQYLKAQQFSGRAERCWLTFCFTFRTISLISSCYKVVTSATAITVFMRFLPSGVKEWLFSLFR
jgi:hypothetical protein